MRDGPRRRARRGAGRPVRGIAGLRVVDASAMPVLPAGNTYLGCVMMAERIAALM
ncbi:GMC oxidoreductase [Yinghuangia aomiensis]